MGCTSSKSNNNHNHSPPVVLTTTNATRPPQQQQQQQQKKTTKPPPTSNNKKKNDTNNNLSPIFNTLPPNAQKYKVRNVYDGDTLTLIDGRRVRLLGIDTPELKEKQDFAEEAKEYTKRRCHKQDIWLTFTSNVEEEQKDHYGRLLAFVWVLEHQEETSARRRTSSSAGGGRYYLNVNEGILAAGLGHTYSPSNTKKKVDNWDKLIQLQKQAREARRGMWHSFTDYKVIKTPNGSAYHNVKKDCMHLSRSKNFITMNVSQAMDLGLHPCRTCMT